jgi:GNAT superfamily N-acetyltransferase
LSAMRLIQSKALYDLVVTRGGAPPDAIPISEEPSAEMGHVLRTDPGLAWIALANGRPVGFGVGFVRDELWFLSDLFVLPEAYGKGIGGELLRRCLAGGERRGARIRAVAASHDLAAQTLYLRAGMVPRFPLFSLHGTVGGLDGLGLSAVPEKKILQVDRSRSWIDALANLDQTIWGRRRDSDHRFWLGEGRGCIAIADGSAAISGYAHYSKARSRQGWNREPYRIGPLAARSPRQQLALLGAIADALSAEGNAAIEFEVPGINMTLATTLLAAGFRIDHVDYFMASETFGRFDRYLPSGGTLL